MKFRWWMVLIALVIILVVTYNYYNFIYEQQKYSPTQVIDVASWNLQVFGDTKANDTGRIKAMASIIDDHDIVFVQEIRDKDGTAFQELCKEVHTHVCVISSRAGRTSSKEQYGILYRSKYPLINLTDYNPDPLDRWERPPIRADFEYKNYSFSVYVLHSKPNDTTSEMKYLEYLVLSENRSNNVLVLGDLNADCYYYDESKRHFSDWFWAIDNQADTTTSNSFCAYDRIIMNKNASDEFVKSAIDHRANSSLSDHYPVSILMRVHEYHLDTRFTTFIMNWFS